LARELLLGETIVSSGGTTKVPKKVMDALGLVPKSGERSKLLWTPVGGEVIAAKGTPQSDWRKTMLRKNGTTAIPRHIRQALKLKISPQDEARVLWLLKEKRVIVRKRTRS
jgi:hypothetical protein